MRLYRYSANGGITTCCKACYQIEKRVENFLYVSLVISAQLSLEITSHMTLPSPKDAGKYSGIFDDYNYLYHKSVRALIIFSLAFQLIFCFIYYNIVIT